jgi:DNA-binding transcriptional ArsR family regulator
MAERCTVPELISTHGLILLCIASTAKPTVARLAAVAGVSERTVSRVLGDLVEAGYVTRRRQGTRNAYTVCPEARVSDRVGRGWPLERLLELSPHAPEAAPRQPV